MAFLAVLRRELVLAIRAGGDTLTLVLFFVLIGVIVPFAIGPDRDLLARIAPGIIWIAALLSALIGLDRLFRADYEDGSLISFRHAAISLEAIVLAKLIAYWLTTIVPLLIASPLLAVMLSISLDGFWRTLLSLCLGTPGLVGLGAIAAALTVALRRGGMLAPVIILPLCVPLVIFGVSAINASAGPGTEATALLYLSGLSLAFFALSPFVTALALKLAGE